MAGIDPFMEDNLSKAEKFYEREMLDQALPLYLEALKTAEGEEKPKILRKIAECYFYRENSDIENALKYIDEAIKISNSIQDRILRFNILSEKDADEALREAQKLVKEAEEKKYLEVLPELYNNMGLLLWGKDEAVDYFKKAMENAKQIKDLENYVLALQNLAYVEKERGNNGKALEYLKEALNAVEEVAKNLPKTKKKDFISSYSDLYDQAVSLAMDMEDFDLAMDIANRGKVS